MPRRAPPWRARARNPPPGRFAPVLRTYAAHPPEPRAPSLLVAPESQRSGFPCSERLGVIVSCRCGVDLDRTQSPAGVEQIHHSDCAVLVGKLDGVGRLLRFHRERVIVALQALCRRLQVRQGAAELGTRLRAHLVKGLERAIVVHLGALDFAFVVVAGEERDAHENAVTVAAAERIGIGTGAEGVVVELSPDGQVACTQTSRELPRLLRPRDSVFRGAYVRAPLYQFIGDVRRIEDRRRRPPICGANVRRPRFGADQVRESDLAAPATDSPPPAALPPRATTTPTTTAS